MSYFYQLIYDVWSWFWGSCLTFFDNLFQINDYFTGVIFTLLLLTVAGFLVDLFFSFMFSVRARRLIIFNPFNPKSFNLIGELKEKSLPRLSLDTKFSNTKSLNRLIIDRNIPRRSIDIKPRYPYSLKPFYNKRLTARLNEFSVLSPVRYYDKSLKSFIYRSGLYSRYNSKYDSHYDSKLDKRSDSQTGGLRSFNLSAGIMTIRYYRLNSLSLSNLYNSLKLSNPNMRITKSQFLRNHLSAYYHSVSGLKNSSVSGRVGGLSRTSAGGVNSMLMSNSSMGTGRDWVRGLRNDKIRKVQKDKAMADKEKNDRVYKTGQKKYSASSSYDSGSYSSNNAYSIGYDE